MKARLQSERWGCLTASLCFYYEDECHWQARAFLIGCHDMQGMLLRVLQGAKGRRMVVLNPPGRSRHAYSTAVCTISGPAIGAGRSRKRPYLGRRYLQNALENTCVVSCYNRALHRENFELMDDDDHRPSNDFLVSSS